MQLARLTSSEIRVELVTKGEVPVLPVEVQGELLRIAQECITNVMKHAQARRAELNLGVASGQLHLCVADDGVGFDPDERNEGFGILSMGERAKRIGARVLVRRTPGLGAR